MLTTVPSHQLADLLSSLVNSSYKEKLDILETLDLEDRFKKALPLVKRQTEGLKMIQNQRKQQITGKSRKLPTR
jgi:ATP-dependent Lon protease